MNAQWQPGLHDPTVLGWITTAAYLAATVLCARLAVRGRRTPEAPLWFGLTALLLFLTINKQLDVQTWLRFAGRDGSQALGLYHHKERIRLGFMVLLALGLGTSAFLLRARLGSFFRKTFPAMAGLALIAVYIVVRGVNFTQLGALAPLELLPEAWQWLLEAAGLALVLLSLLRQAKTPHIRPGADFHT